jgi:hypothetical protein
MRGRHQPPEDPVIERLVHHARRNSIAYLALVCAMLALAGASYAALQVPVGSVGEPQIRNKVIDPIKLDPTYISGSVRHWANVSPNGQMVNSSNLGASASTGTGNYVMTWADAFSARCVVIATVQGGSIKPGGTTTTTTSSSSTSTSTSTSSSTTTSTTSTSSQNTNGGFADASATPQSGSATLVAVATYNAAGQPAPEPFSVAVICPSGAGSGQTFPFTLP